MPLHDWSTHRNWDGVHTYWLFTLSAWLRGRLPAPYCVFAGTLSGLSVAEPDGRPDPQFRSWPDPQSAGPPATTIQAEAVGTLCPEVRVRDQPLLVADARRVVACIELVSPRNKDRPEARENSTRRYASYLLGGLHLVLVDLHLHPKQFSFADDLRALTTIRQPPCPAPFATAYRVKETIGDDEHLTLGLWERPMTIGQPLPSIPLPLGAELALDMDLEPSYQQAAANAYLD